MKTLHKVTGNDRALMSIQCLYCGSNAHVFYCSLSDQFICKECLNNELEKEGEEDELSE